MTDHRRRLEHAITTHPGIHFNGLVRELELARGQVQFHLRHLLGEGSIEQASLYGRTHYFPPGVGAFERGALAVLRRETARDIMVILLDEGPTRPAAVSDALGIARSTLAWHVDHLVEQGLVEKDRSGGRVTLVPTRATETVRLLAAIEPSLPERMVDRFTRLVDQFLDPETSER